MPRTHPLALALNCTLVMLTTTVLAAPPAGVGGITPGGAAPERFPRPARPEFPPSAADLYTIPAVPERGSAAAGALRIQVRHFRLGGAEAHPDQDLDPAAIEAMLEQARLAKPEGFGIVDLEELADQVTKYYRSRGFLVAQAYVPQQDVQDGEVEIRVLEGRLGKIVIDRGASPETAGAGYSDERLARTFEGEVGQVVLKDDMERGLLLLRDYPGFDGNGLFRAGSEPGTTDLVIQPRDTKPFAATVTVDNFGLETSGRDRLRADFTWNNPTGAADRFDLTLLQTFIPTNNLYGGIGYRYPVFDAATAVGFDLSRNAYDVGGEFKALELSGVSVEGELYAERQFLRSRTGNLLGRLSFLRKDAVTQQSDRDLTRDNLAELGLRFSGDFVDTQGITFGELAWYHGFDGRFGAMEDGGSEAGRLDRSGRGVGADFDKIELRLNRLQTLPFEGQTLLLRLEGQWTPDQLASVEQYALGGPDSVRAYPRSEYLTDSGVFASAEWFFRAPGFADAEAFNGHKWGEVFQVSVFADYAKGWINDALRPGESPIRLAGAGVGLRVEEPNVWLARLQIATPLTVLDASNGNNPQFFLDFSYRF